MMAIIRHRVDTHPSGGCLLNSSSVTKLEISNRSFHGLLFLSQEYFASRSIFIAFIGNLFKIDIIIRSIQ